MQDTNVAVLVGNLTRDPELRATASGTPVCKLRIAVNGRRKDASSGEWRERPNYFDVTVWGRRGESCAEYLSKGRKVCVSGELEWREWEASDGGGRRQGVEVVVGAAGWVQFLGGLKQSEAEGENGSASDPAERIPADTAELDGALAGGGLEADDDDMPF